MLDERIKRSSKNRPPPAEIQVPPQKKSPDEKGKRAPQAKPMSSVKSAPQLSRMTKKHGEFQLELDDDDTQAPEMPSLIQHDLDEILNQPIELPKTRMRPPSPSMKLLSGSNDAKSAINLVISQVASNDVTSSIQALAQIDDVLKDTNKAELFAEHVDQFLVVCTLQLRMAYSKHMGDVDMDKDSIIRLYKCLLATTLSMFQSESLGKNASRDVLKDIVHNLLTIMLDSRLQELEDGPQVVRSVNIMIVKIVEKSDPTNIMSALIKLMHEGVASEMSAARCLELVMKCLWKMVRMLPSVINDLNVDRIIGDLHQFLKAFPNNTWRNRSSDTPLRTVKTILHSLAKLKGNKIMSHLSQIETQDSDVEQYLQKVLHNGINGNAMNENNRNEHMNGSPDPGIELRTPRNSSSSNKSKRLSKTTHDMLAEIFKKIGSKENTREGLNDLYDFKNKYPDADLEPFLKKSSQFFQNYIERGLKNIEAERTKTPAPSLTSSSSAGSINNNSGVNTGSAGDGDTQQYWERLKILRARCGLENTGEKTDGTSEPNRTVAALQQQGVRLTDSSSSLSSNSSGGLPSLSGVGSGGGEGETTTSETSSASNLLELKKRLEKIKNSSIK